MKVEFMLIISFLFSIASCQLDDSSPVIVDEELIVERDSDEVNLESLYVNFLLLGQSNAHPRLMEAMVERLEEEYTNFTFLNYRHKGASINNWYTSTPQEYYYNDTDYISNQVITGKDVKAIFWFQGESDAAELNVDNFEQYTKNYLDSLIEFLGYSPDIVIFKIDYNGIDSDTATYTEEIRSQQDNIHEYYSSLLIDTRTYERVDDWHFSNTEYTRLGRDSISEYLLTIESGR